MLSIQKDLVVEIEYILCNEAGQELDSSKESGSLSYIHGHNNIMPGLEKQLVGLKSGDSKKLRVEAKDAYGLRDAALIQKVSSKQFGADISEVKVGMQFQSKDNNGQLMVMTAIEVLNDGVVLDGNHPLAGQPLHFDVKVVSLRDASKEELIKGSLDTESSCCSKSNCCD